ncbi:SsrA-binding protein [Mycoplasma procyoni]|uniref:SsrA-binding protein n=1 Tax=Mycoplasma procyoni TaxID=568784 RepID=UPI00197B8DE3|nr:SsrA-binding protein [Mycoplasma procyoni]MBN3534361.1 SsrA-binding protein [Mycoplasma procyoni]
MKIITKNKIANFDYEILDKYECGISLMGWEVKSIRAQNVNLKGSFAYFKDNELYLSNMHVSLYMAVKGDEIRSRKLLLHKQELKRIKDKQQQQGLTLVPLSLYWTPKSKIKVELALAKGKNKQDKRETIKKRDQERELRKEMRF